MWKDSETELDFLDYGYLINSVTDIIENDELLPACIGLYGDSIVDVTKSKHYNGLGRYISRGYDTYGLFKLVGGLQKGNPTEEEIKRAVDFYKNLL